MKAVRILTNTADDKPLLPFLRIRQDSREVNADNKFAFAVNADHEVFFATPHLSFPLIIPH